MNADVEIAIAENLYPRLAAAGSTQKFNRTAVVVRPRISNQYGFARIRPLIEYRLAASAGARATIVSKGAGGGRRVIEEFYDTALTPAEVTPPAVIDESSASGRRGVEESRVTTSARECAVVCKSRITPARAVVENRPATLCKNPAGTASNKGAIARSGGVEKLREATKRAVALAAVITETATTRGRVTKELRPAGW